MTSSECDYKNERKQEQIYSIGPNVHRQIKT